METDIQRAGPVVYGGDRARDMLIAVMERRETDRDSINYSIVGAVNALVAYTKQYGDFRYMPQRYVDLVDNDFLIFVNVFLKHILILSRLPYIQMKQESL
jgi:hypothetical protein